MTKLALVGKDIGHSMSKQMYEKLLKDKVEYDLLDYQKSSDVESLSEIFKRGYLGISITYPYKKHFLKDVIIEDSKISELNAINCITENKNRFYATNTDFLAARSLVREYDLTSHNVIVLGSGNMATVFKLVFAESRVTVKQLCRKQDGDLNKIKFTSYKNEKPMVIINCCSRGFVFNNSLPSGSLFWDMNYNFREHEHLKEAEFLYQDGLNLLEYQAKFALEFWVKLNN